MFLASFIHILISSGKSLTLQKALELLDQVLLLIIIYNFKIMRLITNDGKHTLCGLLLPPFLVSFP